MFDWADYLLLELKKNNQKFMISNGVAIGMANKARSKQIKTEKSMDDVVDNLISSLTGTISSLDSSLKGEFGTQARQLLTEQTTSLKK